MMLCHVGRLYLRCTCIRWPDLEQANVQYRHCGESAADKRSQGTNVRVHSHMPVSSTVDRLDLSYIIHIDC